MPVVGHVGTEIVDIVVDHCSRRSAGFVEGLALHFAIEALEVAIGWVAREPKVAGSHLG